ncbi:MAG: hypothetical protein GY757_04320 [bacterium]|nr:hypothetical protein [bacterium]
MMRIRTTSPGAYHHVMNQGYDGNYGMCYRKLNGGKGYVFQGVQRWNECFFEPPEKVNKKRASPS